MMIQRGRSSTDTQRTLAILRKIEAFWPPDFGEHRLAEIIPMWSKKLYIFTDDTISAAIEDLAGRYHCKPTLAEFIETCKAHVKTEPMAVYKVPDNLPRAEYLGWVREKFGEAGEETAKEAFAKFDQCVSAKMLDYYIADVRERLEEVIRKKNAI